MSDLPPYLQMLKQRSNQQSKAPPPPKHNYQDDYDDNYQQEEQIHYNHQQEELYPEDKTPQKPQRPAQIRTPRQLPADEYNEADELRQVISDLEEQINDLSTENRKLRQCQGELEQERLISIEFGKQVDELRDQLHDEQEKNQSLTEQVNQLVSLLSSKQQMTDAKENMLQRLQAEYQQLMSDYQNLLDKKAIETGQLRQAKQQISELESEIEELRQSQRFNKRRSETPLYNDYNDNGGRLYGANQNDFDLPNQSFNRDFGAPRLNDDFGAPKFNNDYDAPAPNFGNYNDPAPSYDFPPQTSVPSYQPVQEQPPAMKTPVRKAALEDNICFGEPEQTGDVFVRDVDIEEMTIPEMKQKLKDLQFEKDAVEKKLSKAPEKGRLMAHVRREQEENEERLDELIKQMSKLRLRLKQRNAM